MPDRAPSSVEDAESSQPVQVDPASLARWEDTEPTAGVVFQRLRRAFAKMRLRSTWLIVIFLLAAIGVTTFLRTRKAVYVAKVTFRVKDDGNAALDATDAALKENVARNYFTHGQLLDIIRAHGLYPSRLKRAPYLAVESFREDIDVDAARYEADGSGERLPLRISISFIHADPMVARTVAGELSQLVIDGSRASLAAKYGLAVKQATGAADAAFQHSTIATRIAAQKDGDRARAKAIEERLLEALRDRTTAELRAAEELKEHALEFEMIDTDVRVRNQPPTLPIAVIISLLVASLSVALGGVLLGAGTSFVTDEADLEALSLSPLVTVSLQRGKA